jgi:outer membrane protein assembly factor BamD
LNGFFTEFLYICAIFLTGMKRSVIFYLSISFVILSACSNFEKVVKSTDYRFKYREAVRYYNKGDYYRAQTLFDQIAPVFRGTIQADTVYYYQAMSYYQQSDYIMAGYYFSMFSKMYGGSPFVENADYMTAYCYFLTSPRAELDQESTMNAIQSFQLYLIKYPNSTHIDDVKKYVEQLRDKLAEKAYLSAKLYYDLEDFKASIVALNNCLTSFPESEYRERIMFMLLKSSFMYADQSITSKKKERYQAAIDEYYSFKAEFPSSKMMKDAEKYFKTASAYLGTDINANTSETN